MSAHLTAAQLDSVMDREYVAHHIVDSAVAIHTAPGPGFPESVYRRCRMHEPGLRGLRLFDNSFSNSVLFHQLFKDFIRLRANQSVLIEKKSGNSRD